MTTVSPPGWSSGAGFCELCAQPADISSERAKRVLERIMTSTPPSTSVAVRAAEARAYWSLVPSRINQTSIAVVEKAAQQAGWLSTAAAAAAIATVSGAMLGTAGAKLATTLASGAGPEAVGLAATLGLAAGAAPAIAGFVSALTKDGAARGILEGAGVATVYFVGMLAGVVSGLGDGVVFLGATAGALATLAYGAGVFKRW
jgi:hypothetical protein